MLMHFSYICTFISLHSYIDLCWCFFVCVCVCLSLSFYALVCSMAPKRKSAPSQNPLRFRASSFDSTPTHVQFHDEKAHNDFLENFSQCGIHSKCQVVLSDFSDTDFPIVIHNKGWELLCGIPITCPSIIIQEFYSNMHGFDYSIPLFITRVRSTRFVVTPNIVSKVLHVSRVTHPDYPGCDHLKTVSKDELSSFFCETPSFWGERQNTPCSAFAKGPRCLNMVMTFVLYPLSIILLLSLVLDFCYPYLRDLLLIFSLISYSSL